MPLDRSTSCETWKLNDVKWHSEMFYRYRGIRSASTTQYGTQSFQISRTRRLYIQLRTIGWLFLLFLKSIQWRGIPSHLVFCFSLVTTTLRPKFPNRHLTISASVLSIYFSEANCSFRLHRRWSFVAFKFDLNIRKLVDPINCESLSRSISVSHYTSLYYRE